MKGEERVRKCDTTHSLILVHTHTHTHTLRTHFRTHFRAHFSLFPVQTGEYRDQTHGHGPTPSPGQARSRGVARQEDARSNGPFRCVRPSVMQCAYTYVYCNTYSSIYSLGCVAPLVLGHLLLPLCLSLPSLPSLSPFPTDRCITVQSSSVR